MVGLLPECVHSLVWNGDSWVKHEPIVKRLPLPFEDAAFVVGSSPAVLDINDAYGENGREFTVKNDGAGNLTVAITNDGSTWSDEHTVVGGDSFNLQSISVDSIRITWVANTAYRVVAL